MSIDTELTRIEGAKSDIFDMIVAKGGVVPAGSKLEDVPDLLADFPVIEWDFGSLIVGEETASWTSNPFAMASSSTAPYPAAVSITSQDLIKEFIVKRFKALDKKEGALSGLKLIKEAGTTEWKAVWTSNTWAGTTSEEAMPGLSLSLSEIGLSMDSGAEAVEGQKWGVYIMYSVKSAGMEPTYVPIDSVSDFSALCQHFTSSTKIAVGGVAIDTQHILGYSFSEDCATIGDNFLYGCFNATTFENINYLETVGDYFLAQTKFAGGDVEFTNLTTVGDYFMYQSFWYISSTSDTVSFPSLTTIGDYFLADDISSMPSGSGWNPNKAGYLCVVSLPAVETIGNYAFYYQYFWTQPTLDLSSATHIGHSLATWTINFSGIVTFGANTVVDTPPSGTSLRTDLFCGGPSPTSFPTAMTVVVNNTTQSPVFVSAITNSEAKKKTVTVKGPGRQLWITALQSQTYANMVNVIDGGEE